MRGWAVLLALICNGSAAEWTMLSGGDSQTIYADSASTLRHGISVKMWYMADFAAARIFDGKKYQSAKYQAEFDCNGQQSRNIFILVYAGNKGEGDVIYSNLLFTFWSPVPPSSAGEALWKLACGKK